MLELRDLTILIASAPKLEPDELRNSTGRKYPAGPLERLRTSLELDGTTCRALNSMGISFQGSQPDRTIAESIVDTPPMEDNKEFLTENPTPAEEVAFYRLLEVV